MADFLDEVIEDVKNERFRRVFDKYGNYLVTFALLTIFLAGISVWYKDYKRNQVITSGNLFFAAESLKEQGKIDEAIVTLDEVVEKSSGGYADLAELIKAGELQKQGKIAQAAEIYDDVSDSGSNEAIRDMAELHNIFLSIEYPDKVSDDDGEEGIDADLAELAKTGRPWQFSAMELQGLIAIKRNDTEKAKEIFTMLQEDALSPRSIKERASVMLSTL